MKRVIMVFLKVNIVFLFLMIFISCVSEYGGFLDSDARKVYKAFKNKVENYRITFLSRSDSLINFIDSKISFFSDDKEAYSDKLLYFDEDTTKRIIVATLGDDVGVVQRLIDILSTLDLRFNKDVGNFNDDDVNVAISFLKELEYVTKYGIILLNRHLSNANLAKIKDYFKFEEGLVTFINNIMFHLDYFMKAREELISDIKHFVNEAAARRGDKLMMVSYLKSLVYDGILSNKILIGIVDNVLKIEDKLNEILKS
ncbi:hypothetical protein [Borrelia hispanica]|uniref:hypothetical protein n=1 Tax=Borrelia hispanica TaxID=40835 RepID=UPI000464DC62|nr:hypothetical protein [Borrelia hispanica]